MEKEDVRERVREIMNLRFTLKSELNDLQYNCDHEDTIKVNGMHFCTICKSTLIETS